LKPAATAIWTGILALTTAGPAAAAPSIRDLRLEPGRAQVERIVGGPTARRRGFWRWLTGEPAEELFSRPYGVAWDGDDLIVTDPAAGRVLRIDGRGHSESSAPGLFEGPIGVAKCGSGLFVTDSRAGTVSRLGPDLRLERRLAEGLSRPTGVACDGDEVFVVETARHRILVLAPEGGVRRELGARGAGPGAYNFPAALAADQGTLWVGDTLNFRLQNIGPKEGAYLRGFGRLGDAPGDTPRVKGISVDAASRLWITDAHLDRVLLFDADGEFLADVGRPGTSPGEFSFPAGVAAHPDGRVAVVDSLNRRVQILRIVAQGENEP